MVQKPQHRKASISVCHTACRKAPPSFLQAVSPDEAPSLDASLREQQHREQKPSLSTTPASRGGGRGLKGLSTGFPRGGTSWVRVQEGDGGPGVQEAGGSVRADSGAGGSLQPALEKAAGLAVAALTSEKQGPVPYPVPPALEAGGWA